MLSDSDSDPFSDSDHGLAHFPYSKSFAFLRMRQPCSKSVFGVLYQPRLTDRHVIMVDMIRLNSIGNMVLVVLRLVPDFLI